MARTRHGLPGIYNSTPITLSNEEGAALALNSSGQALTDLATALAGEDVANDVIKVEQRFSYANIVLAAPTTTVVKSGAGFLHSITFNKPVATGVVTIYDNTAASGTLIGTITVPASPMPVTLFYDAAFTTGLTIVTATAAQDITVSYR